MKYISIKLRFEKALGAAIRKFPMNQAVKYSGHRQKVKMDIQEREVVNMQKYLQEQEQK